MIALHWLQPRHDEQTAQHGDWSFTVRREQDWSRHPAVTYRYAASARQHGAALHDLGIYANSKSAKERCAEFINQQAQGVST